MSVKKDIRTSDIFPEEILQAVKKYLIKNKETVAVAESVTSGLIQLAFGTIEDASCFYQGGITAYNLGQKYRHLLIEPIYAEEYDCISQSVASEMAVNVCELFKSSWGLSITGYATPIKATGNKLYAYCSIVYNKKIILAKKITPRNTDPFAVQIEYAQITLRNLKNCMYKKMQIE